MVVNYLFCVLLFFVASLGFEKCNGQGNDTVKNQRGFSLEKDSVGRITAQGPVKYENGIGVNDGLWTFWNYTGSDTIKKERFFRLGVMDGPGKNYYASGHLESSMSFKNNQKDGLERQFDETGKLQAEIFWRGDIQGLSKWYYFNGRIKLINVYDLDGEPIYVQHWDSLGNLLTDEGLAIGNSLSLTMRDTMSGSSLELDTNAVPVNKDIQILIIVPGLPDVENVTTMTIVDSVNNVVQTMQATVVDCFALGSMQIAQKGNYRIVCSSKAMNVRKDILRSGYQEHMIRVQ